MTFWFTVWHSIHSATPARTAISYYYTDQPYSAWVGITQGLECQEGENHCRPSWSPQSALWPPENMGRFTASHHSLRATGQTLSECPFSTAKVHHWGVKVKYFLKSARPQRFIDQVLSSGSIGDRKLKGPLQLRPLSSTRPFFRNVIMGIRGNLA